jgi:hypothetical protein
MGQATNYSLQYGDRLIPLRSVRHDHAALEALRVLGASIVSNRAARASVGTEVTLTVYLLDGVMTLSSKRLGTFAALPRPVSVEYLRNLRLPDRVLTGMRRLGDRSLPFLAYLAKVLNTDDGSVRPHHEWMQQADEIDRRLIAAPPTWSAEQSAAS